MIDQYPGAARFLPTRRSLTALRAAVGACRGCPLYRRATQPVFGSGRVASPLVLVGEQPGNDEDLSGKPFVGPAGRVLDDALAAAGIDRADAYVTNTVKHFKWEGRGEKRIHAKPNLREIRACMPWLTAELETIKPKVLVATGATAAQALFGTSFRVTVQHGRAVESSLATHALGTIHPSAVLRQRSSSDRKRAYESLVADLTIAAGLLD